jgi:uncharacterized protein YpbB
MSSNTNVSLNEIDDFVKSFFECEEKISALELQKINMNAEMALIQNLQKALQIIERGRP